jgi:ribosomal protein S12 methylthiotransferase
MWINIERLNTALLKALGADYKHELLGERLTTTPKKRLSKIAEGCDTDL